MARTATTRYDLIWKEAIRKLLPEFLELLFPRVYADVDWSTPPEFLDRQLSMLLRIDGRGGRSQTVDVLVRLRMRSGRFETLLLHNVGTSWMPARTRSPSS